MACQNLTYKGHSGGNVNSRQPNSTNRPTTASSSKSLDDPFTKSPEKLHCNYTVNLRLAPVEYGIKCYSSLWHNHQFTGINAFNFYFDFLLPRVTAYYLPDVWDGYFHITLGKFCLTFDNKLEEKEKCLVDYIKKETSLGAYFANIFPCKFRSEGLNIHPGGHRFDNAEGVDFVTLKVTDLDNTLNELSQFLEIIKNGVKEVGGQWENKSLGDYRNQLHVTVRKYKDNHSKWSSKFIQNCGILDRVRDNPLEFQCVALDIAQTRRQARARSSPQWWIGVTGIQLACEKCGKIFPDDSPGFCPACRLNGNDHECSGCGRREEEQMSWPGHCHTCGNYERIRPLWSTKP